MKLYIAGPMTGIPRFNYPAFDEAAEMLRDLGHEPVNPCEVDGAAWRVLASQSPDGDGDVIQRTLGMTWADFLSRDIKLLADTGIEGVFCLPGWQKSKGARLETFVAHALLGLPIFRAKFNGHPGVVLMAGADLGCAWLTDGIYNALIGEDY